MGFSFGAPSTNAPAPAAGGGFNFTAPAPSTTAGGSGGGFNFAAAPSKSDDASKAKPSGGGLFGAAPAPAAADTTKAPAPSGGFSFGAPSTNTTTADASKTSTNTTAAPSTGGFSFGAPAATKDSNSTTDKDRDTTTPAAKSGGLFGSTPAPAPATGGGLFGSTSGTTPGTTPAAKAPEPVKTPNSSGGGLFGSTPATTITTTPATGTTTTNSTTTTTTAAPASSTQPSAPKVIEPPPIEYQSLTIEQILNRFQSELETDTIAFLTEAQRIAHYDATLRESQNSLSELTNMVSRLMLHQTEVDTQLQGIGSYQNELSSTLDLLERNVDELFASQSNVNIQDSDIQREKSYERAIDVDNKLDSMTSSLQHVVNDLNAAQERVWSASGNGGLAEGNNEEVGQIIGVFNAHHDTLAYLESKARSVESDLAVIGQVLQKSGQ